MKLKEFNIMLDIKKHNKIEYIEIVQGDFESNVLNISIVEGFEPYNLAELNVEIAFAKPDGTTVVQDKENGVTIVDPAEGKIRCILNTNTIASPGKVIAEVRVLSDIDDMLLTSSRFEFFVRKAIFGDDTIKSTNEWPLLKKLLEASESEELRETEESIRQSNEEERIQNEQTREDNELNRNINEEQRIVKETERDVSESTRINSEDERIANEESREINEQNRQSNEAARIEEENIRQSNEVTRNENEDIRISQEESRVLAEESRESNETIRQQNENERESNEVIRVSNEDERELNESNRVSAEGERIQAELDRQREFLAAVESATIATDNANTAATKAENKIVDVENRFQTLTTEQQQDAEIIDARQGELSLGANLVGIKKQVSNNLQKAHLSSMQSSRNASTLRPLVTFIDDDGYNGVLTKLKPLFLSRGVPMGLALRGDSVVIVDPIKRAEILDLQNNHGWEILSHTMAHMNIQNSTDEEVENDFKTFLETFQNYGFNVENIVYPGGQVAGKYPIIAKYFRAGFGTGMAVNDIYNIRDYNVYRMALGSSMIPEYDTLDKFKELIDTAKANNQWIVFMTHCDYINNDMQIIEDVLDYVIEQEIDIVTPNEGLRVFGSVVQSGLKSLSDYTVLKPNGIVDTNVYELTKRLPAKSENDPPEPNQSPNKISKFEVRGWSIGDGIVTEYVHQQAWEYQEFRRTGTSPRVYVRKWKGLGWTPWSQYALATTPINYTMTARTIPANGTIDVTVVDESILAWHTHIAQPSLTPEAGLMWQCWAHGNGALKIRLYNTTNNALNLAERIWKISRIAINW